MSKMYIKVSNDRLEQIVAWGNNAPELARILGISTNTIYTSMSHERLGERKSPYEIIEIDDEEENEESD